MSPVATLDINRLIGGHRVQPRTDFSLRIEQVAFQVHLHKGGLERVLGEDLIAQESPQVVI